MEGDDAPFNLSGWLLIPGLGVFTAPAALLFGLGETWPGPMPVPARAAILVWTGALFLASFRVIWLFMNERRAFVPAYVMFSATCVLLPAAAWAGAWALSGRIDAATGRQLIALAAYSAIWIAYILRSRRVRAIFVN